MHGNNCSSGLAFNLFIHWMFWQILLAKHLSIFILFQYHFIIPFKQYRVIIYTTLKKLVICLSYIAEVDFLWNRTVDSLKTSFHRLLWTSSDLRDSWKTTSYMGNGKVTEHAQNLQRCEKCNLRKAVGNLEMPYGCEITVIVQEGLKTCYISKLY